MTDIATSFPHDPKPLCSAPGEAFAEIPGILGFYPHETLILVAERTEGPGPVLSMDLADIEHLAQAATDLAAHRPVEVLALLVTRAPSASTTGELIWNILMRELPAVAGLWIVPELTEGEEYRLCAGRHGHRWATNSGWGRGTVPPASASASMREQITAGVLPRLSRAEALTMFDAPDDCGTRDKAPADEAPLHHRDAFARQRSLLLVGQMEGITSLPSAAGKEDWVLTPLWERAQERGRLHPDDIAGEAFRAIRDSWRWAAWMLGAWNAPRSPGNGPTVAGDGSYREICERIYALSGGEPAAVLARELLDEENPYLDLFASLLGQHRLRDIVTGVILAHSAEARPLLMALAFGLRGPVRANALCLYAAAATVVGRSWEVPLALAVAAEEEEGHVLARLMTGVLRTSGPRSLIRALLHGAEAARSMGIDDADGR